MGAGALGNEIIKNLALLGAGSLIIVDLDRIERSNLARCVLFREEDAGLTKAPVAAARARELNPEISVVPIEGDIQTDLGLGVFREADVVLGALDNRDARLFLNECCWKTQTPWVDGAIEGMMGEMRVFTPPESVDYAATLSETERKELERRRACTLLPPEVAGEKTNGRVPTTATTASVIAGLQVQEAIKLIHRDRFDYQFGGRGFLFNGITHDSYPVDYSQGKTESPITYSFDDSVAVVNEETLGKLLELAEDRLGGTVTLQLEREILLSMTCTTCDQIEEIRTPAKAVPESALDCQECGRQRRMDLVHRISRDRPELLELSTVELGLPPADIVTATNGEKKELLLLAPRTRDLFVTDAGT